MNNHIRAIHYALHITPDLERFQFQGSVEIQFQADAPVATIALNSQYLAVWRCLLLNSGGWIDCPFSVDPDKQTLAIVLPAARQGRIAVKVDYEGLINDQMAGFYRSRFTQDGQTKYIAVTQFQESAARQAFPCLDHPLHKAAFELRMTVPDALHVLSNTLPAQQVPLDHDRKEVRFQPTPHMSTYLLFFGVGEFQWVQDQQDPRVRVVHLPGLGHTTDLGLDFGRKALQYCENYYGIPYPLPKMDLIAVPDFAFGAMENWGAITFRENLLLSFPELTSKAGTQRICEVIAHEIAHQWFGNLVTPSDWKYLWLNESFATYFGFGVVAHHYPQWGIWDQFLHVETASALSRDGLQETFAIEIPGGEHLAINSSTAPIIYNKGASILRMIEGHIGHDRYQQGVRSYLQRHQYACAESHHLWEAFEGASDQPITAMMQSWIGQPGHPVIVARRQGLKLSLSQERFCYLGGQNEQTWLVPTTLTIWTRDGQAQQRRLLLEEQHMTVDLPGQTTAYKLNTGQTGFYRVYYDDTDNLAALGQAVAHKTLTSEDRWGLQNDLYAFVRQCRVPLEEYFRFLDHYRAESEYLPLVSIADHLHQLSLVAPPSRFASITDYTRRLAQRILTQVEFTPAAEELQTTAILRDQMIWQASLWGWEPAAQFAVDQFRRLTSGQNVPADIAKGIMQVGAWLLGQEALEWLCQRFTQSPSEHERMNILAALGAFQTWELSEQALAFTLDQVPPRNRFIPIAAAAVNPNARLHMWSWYQSHIQVLEQFHPLLYERVITSIFPYGGLENAESVQQFGQKYLETHPALADAMRLALENLEINVRMREYVK